MQIEQATKTRTTRLISGPYRLAAEFLRTANYLALIKNFEDETLPRGDILRSDNPQDFLQWKTLPPALTLAGFTSGGEPLSHLLRPQALFTHIIEKWLEFRGEPLAWDILNSSSWKRTKRLLLGVATKKPLGLGWLQPSFILSLDTSSSPQSPLWHVLEPQIFTKLPWLKTVTPRRLEQFEELCRQLAQLHQLQDK